MLENQTQKFTPLINNVLATIKITTTTTVKENTKKNNSN